jgi:hypothetical protein
MSDLRDLILIAAYLVVGLFLYMAENNLRWQFKYRIPYRWGYALAYFCVAGLIWEVATYVIKPAQDIPGDWKSWLFFAFLVGVIIGTAGIISDSRRRRKQIKEVEDAR